MLRLWRTLLPAYFPSFVWQLQYCAGTAKPGKCKYYCSRLHQEETAIIVYWHTTKLRKLHSSNYFVCARFRLGDTARLRAHSSLRFRLSLSSWPRVALVTEEPIGDTACQIRIDVTVTVDVLTNEERHQQWW